MSERLLDLIRFDVDSIFWVHVGIIFGIMLGLFWDYIGITFDSILGPYVILVDILFDAIYWKPRVYYLAHIILEIIFVLHLA